MHGCTEINAVAFRCIYGTDAKACRSTRGRQYSLYPSLFVPTAYLKLNVYIHCITYVHINHCLLLLFFLDFLLHYKNFNNSKVYCSKKKIFFCHVRNFELFIYFLIWFLWWNIFSLFLNEKNGVFMSSFDILMFIDLVLIIFV